MSFHNSSITVLINKRVLVPILAALVVAAAVTSVIYAQSDDIQFRQVTLPTSGHFHHDIYSPRMEMDLAGVDVYDSLVSAVFENPYSRRGGRFVYGFVLRVNSEPDNPPVEFYVSSNRTWYLWAGDKEYSGFAPIYIDAYDRNRLTIQLSGEYATLYLNGTQVEDDKKIKRFHLGKDTAKGDVWIVNGPFLSSVQHDAITHYDLFTIFAPVSNGSSSVTDALEDSKNEESFLEEKGLPDGFPGIDQENPSHHNEAGNRIPFEE